MKGSHAPIAGAAWICHLGPNSWETLLTAIRTGKSALDFGGL
jgi:hypothetical protein